ncbi:MAG: stage II sporulation protein M [Lachnospiraceae bacterium]|nr:stage II sporulation protein M [Lachnospiraceae bacterium]
MKIFMKISLSMLFWGGFAAGVTAGMICKASDFVWISERLYELKGNEINRSVLIYDVLKCRLGVPFFMILAASTWLYPFLIGFVIMRLACGLGFFGGASIKLYGLKGVLLPACFLFPQMFFYLPGYFILIGWCRRLYEGIYRKAERDKIRNLMELAGMTGFIGVGIWMELTVNPDVVKRFLELF